MNEFNILCRFNFLLFDMQREYLFIQKSGSYLPFPVKATTPHVS